MVFNPLDVVDALLVRVQVRINLASNCQETHQAAIHIDPLINESLDINTSAGTVPPTYHGRSAM
jgi:hypothetical protein